MKVPHSHARLDLLGDEIVDKTYMNSMLRWQSSRSEFVGSVCKLRGYEGWLIEDKEEEQMFLTVQTVGSFRNCERQLEVFHLQRQKNCQSGFQGILHRVGSRIQKKNPRLRVQK